VREREPVLDLVSVLDPDGRIVFASHSHEAVLGYAPEALVGHSAVELVHPADREALTAADGQVTSIRLRHRGGDWVAFEGTIAPLPEPGRRVAVWRDVTRTDRLRAAQHGVTSALAGAVTLEEGAAGVLEAVVGQLDFDAGLLRKLDGRCVASTSGEISAPGVRVPVDVAGEPWGALEFVGGEAGEPEHELLATIGAQLGQFIQRTLAEQAVHEERLRKLAVVDAALDCVVTMDHRGRILEFNPAAERTFGYSAEDVVGRELADVLVPRDLRDRHRAGLARYLETGESTIIGRRIEMSALAADGREVPVELTVARVDLPGPPLFSGYIRDITARVRAEQALRASRSLLQAVADGTPDALFVKDLEGTYLLINEAGARALGRTVKEVVGARDADLMAAEAAAGLVESDRRVIETGQTHVSEDRVGDRIFLATKSPYRDGDGQVLGVLGVAHDITERRRLEAELQQAQKMEIVGRLAGGVAHDFNNLLTVIRGFTELAHQRLSTSGDVEGPLREVTRASDRGSTLTQQLLSLSRRAPVATEALDVNAVVADMDALLRRVIGEDLRLVTVFGASAATVRANRSQLEQAILNLAINARDAMPSGGKLTIETADAQLDERAARELGVAPGPHVVLRVSDTGTGMDDETSARVFEPFFTTKPAGQGTGLGLATVYGIVTQSGGHIAVRTSPGAGATFVIHLPVAAESADALSPTSVPAAPATTGAGRLLIAEDDDALRSFLEAALHEHAAEVLTAGSGEEALAIAAAHGWDIDVLVSDVVMPGMRGTELAARLRERCPGVRVVLATGYSDQPLADERRDDTVILSKPFTVAELVQAMARPRTAAGRSTRSSGRGR
jgi:two-component system cell cycle sensor histidine kinase/response regulator CckA